MKSSPLFLLFNLAFLINNGHAQNVGVGTISPSEKFHVNGNIKGDTIKPNAIKLSPNAGNGKILTSDATGNASWQERSSSIGGVGFGAWGDCSMNDISEYNPVGDSTSGNGDQFGWTVSLSGNDAIVGAPQDDAPLINSGSVCFFHFNGVNWLLSQKLSDATGASGDGFGYNVSISGNFAVVGAPFDDIGSAGDQGSASIYQYNGTNWVLMQKLTDVTGAAGDRFGQSVSISGNYVIVAAPYDDIESSENQGSASIYQYNGTSWVLMQKLIDPAGSQSHFFGFSVSISAAFAAVGAPGPDQGGVVIYRLSGGTTWQYMQKIVDASGSNGDQFGFSVSISGNYLIAGAPFDTASDTVTGSICIFQFKNLTTPTWVFIQKIATGNDYGYAMLGASVSISGNYAIIGTRQAKVGSHTHQGSALILVKVGAAWKKLQFITEPEGRTGDFFGVSISIDANTKRFLVGAYGFMSEMGNAIFGKINN